MQKLLYEPNYQQQNGLCLNELVFMRAPDADFVTLFGTHYEPTTGELRDRDLGCDFSMLTDLLLLAGDPGDKLIRQLALLLADDRIDMEEPVSLDISALLGQPLTLKDIALKIYKPMEQDSSGHWSEMQDAYFLIENFRKLSANELHYLELAHHFSGLLCGLEAAYRQYRQLRRNSFSKKAARKKAGLKDELLFRLAKSRHKMRLTGGLPEY